MSQSLQEALKNALSYMPVVYTQKRVSSLNNGVYEIKYPYGSIPDNALLYMLPLKNAIDTSSSGKNILRIRTAVVDSATKTVRYDIATPKEYTILIETAEGSRRLATSGDIISNRLCMFRFITGDRNNVILCNNPIYNNIKCVDITSTNLAKFYNKPVVVTITNGIETQNTVALSKELQILEDRISTLESKIQTGTQTAEEFFTENNELPTGTIYMQMED